MDVKEASALFFQALCKDRIKPIIRTAYEIFQFLMLPGQN